MSNARASFASITLIALAIGGAATAQKPQEQVFKDKQGRLKLWNMDSHEINVQNKGPIKFEGEGRPIKGVSQDQGLTLECQSLSADLETLKGKGYVLRSANLVGSVVLVQSKDGSSKTFKGAQAQIEDQGSQATVHLPKPFSLHETAREAEGASYRSLTASGGRIILDSFQSPSPQFRTAKAEGSVVFDLKEPVRDFTLKSEQLSVALGQGAYTLELPQPFQLKGSTSPKPGERNLLSAQADSGSGKVLEKVKKEENSILSLDLKGNVSIEITTIVKGEKGERQRVVKAKAPSLVFSRETGRMVLSGGVSYSLDSREPGEEPVEAEGASEVLEITFDPSGRLLNASAKSGRTTIREGDKP